MSLRFPHLPGARRWAQGGVVVLGVAGLCGFLMPLRTPIRPRPSSKNSFVLTVAKYQAQPAEPLPMVIEADAMRRAPEDPNALRAIQEAILHIVPNPPDPASVEAVPAEPAWMLWGRLRTTPASVSMLPDAGVRAYAVHSAQGMTLCLVNASSEKKQIRLQIRLPRGVYKLERLIFSPPNLMVQASRPLRATPTESRLRTVSHDGQATAVMPTVVPVTQLERMQGRTLNAAGTIRKPCLLLPGQVCLYRYTDVAQAARAALNETYDGLHTMALRSPGPAQRLRHILEEGNGKRGSLSAGSGQSSSARLSGIHRLLLLTAQVQSMQRNYQHRHVVGAEEGAAVMGALERLTDALAETSAALLELVPQIVVNAESEPGAAAMPDAAETTPPSRRLTVTMSLANLGRQSVGMVKLGLDTAALPHGVVCAPDDPAYFGSVHPGQSVRATFHLRCPAGTPLPTDRCGGDVSYFVSGTPAHLRIRAW